MDNKELFILLGLLVAVLVIGIICWRGTKSKPQRSQPPRQPPMTDIAPPQQQRPDSYGAPQDVPQTSLMDQQYGGPQTHPQGGPQTHPQGGPQTHPQGGPEGEPQGMPRQGMQQGGSQGMPQQGRPQQGAPNQGIQQYRSYNETGDPRTAPLGTGPGAGSTEQYTYL